MKKIKEELVLKKYFKLIVKAYVKGWKVRKIFKTNFINKKI